MKIIAFLVACLDDDSKTKSTKVRLTNATATKSITFFKYKESGESSYGIDLIGGTHSLKPSSSYDFTLSECDKKMDFQSGSYLDLFGTWEWKEKFLACGQTLYLIVSD